MSSFDEVQKKLDKAAIWFATEMNTHFTMKILESKIWEDVIYNRITSEEFYRRLDLLTSPDRKEYLELLKIYTPGEEIKIDD